MRAIRRRDLVGLLAWILTAEFVVGMVGLVIARHEGTSDVVEWVAVSLTAVLATVHWVRRDDPPRWLGGLGLLWVELTIVEAIASDPDPGSSGFLHILLVWVGVVAFGFLPRRQAWVHTTLAIAATAAYWVLDDTPLVEVLVAGVLLAGTVVGVGLLLALLVDEARDHARTDVLTGVANRRGLLAALDDAVEDTSHTDRPLSLLLLDLDGFKRVNDELGHAAGDELLQRTTAAWQSALRDEDVIGRLGGDEFLVVLPDADESAAARIADRLVELTPRAVGVTIGNATVADGETGDAALARADAVLYARKRGRGRPAALG